MSSCTCPEDRQTIPSTHRVILLEPTYETYAGNVVIRDPSKAHIYDSACPLHGYKVLSDEGETTNDDHLPPTDITQLY